MATSLAEIEALARREVRRREQWQRWRRLITVVSAVVVGVAAVLWANWMLQRYVILGDDTERGELFRQTITAPAGSESDRHFSFDQYVFNQCQAAAEAFYGHGLLDSEPGYAPPNEKAFFHACSGAFLGGRGGGDGD